MNNRLFLKNKLKPPVIITLQLESDAAAFFTTQRTTYFPKHINYLDAHLTLFHALPPGEPLIDEILKTICQRNPFQLEVTGLKNIGNGVAYSAVSAELQIMHLALQKKFDAFLIGKDRQKLWPHITVQNKVTAFKAQQLFEKLSSDFIPFSIEAIGISSWYYMGGPWEFIEYFPFKIP